ncbi:FAD-dependent oxidoreductase [Cryptosporangium aurantiacum]|uniref:2-polyprenyl-6-methoxyphenol hydroxylase n=1 Tax=Cryptosporangium aurantiacum TaxID=134849 RepID=A0A1M7RKS0_9ACTN|nr:NAD(P)/FAD-dependent oxidoreductase [Cryptosporangium aurantiacum]SHN46751.1 2-polyprenyl-6-methoxyphenol hydroxylase [Cryptosporangium aurantiacum]
MSAPSTPPRRGRVAVLGGGPAGMATALSVHQAGHEVVIFERYREARPAGNVLNLWPPPLKALGLIGVDTTDLGAPCVSQFRNDKGRVRATIKSDPEIEKRYGRGGGFIGLLRPELYERMLAALPPGVLRTNQTVERIEQDERAVTLHFADGTSYEADVLIGADGIDSLVRRTLWGDSPKREHRLHAIAGYTFSEDIGGETGYCVIGHGREVQGSWTSIRYKGRDGYQWWVLEACDPDAPPPPDLLARAKQLGRTFPHPLPQLIERTEAQHVQRWVLRDRGFLPQWSKGRITLAGDAAHATSPYAAYGAGMAIEDGYFIGRRLRGVDLTDADAVARALQAYEEPRKPHTAFQVKMAYRNGQMFHHAPRLLRPVRDFLFDRTPFLQKVVGDTNPAEINKQLALITD